MSSIMAKRNGFTIVELIIVIVLIGILSTFLVATSINVMANARNSQRSTNVRSIAEAIEKYYDKNGEYPSCTQLTNPDLTTVANTIGVTNKSILTAPEGDAGTNSLICDDLSESSDDLYSYIGDGSSDCLTGPSCYSFILQYREENTGNIISIPSRRVAVPSVPTGFVANAISGTRVDLSWNASRGATYYQLDYSLSPSFSTFSTIEDIASTSSQITDLIDSTPYYFRLYAVNDKLAKSQPTPTINSTTKNLSFVSVFGGIDTESVTGVVSTLDGGYAIVGTTLSYGAGNEDAFIAKIDSNGELDWFKTWGSTNVEFGNAITKTSDGGFAITGQTNSYGSGRCATFLAKFTSNGTLSWSKLWDEDGYNYGNSIIQTSDGGYAITGKDSTDAFIAKFTSAGALSWVYDWGNNDTEDNVTESIAQTSDGGYVIAGYTQSFGYSSTQDAFIAKFTSAGVLSWSKTWGRAGSEKALYVIQTSDSGYVMTGQTTTYGEGGLDAFIAKFTSAGVLSWSKTWGGTGTDIANPVIQTSDSGYLVAGYSDGDSVLLKYASDGTLSWSKSWGGSAQDNTFSMAKTSDGGVVVVGTTLSYGAGNYDAYIIKYTSTYEISNCLPANCKSVSKTAGTWSAYNTSPSVTLTTPTGTVTTRSPLSNFFNPTFTPVVNP